MMKTNTAQDEYEFQLIAAVAGIKSEPSTEKAMLILEHAMKKIKRPTQKPITQQEAEEIDKKTEWLLKHTKPKKGIKNVEFSSWNPNVTINLPVRASNVLKAYNKTTIGAVSELTSAEILRFRNGGLRTLADIRYWLATHGYKLKDEKL